MRYTDKNQLCLFPKFVYDEQDFTDPRTEAQRQLKNFWERPKSNSEKGAIYERYIGYLYEDAGYHVEYTGIKKGKKDIGRDLVCRVGRDVFIVQCKCWENSKMVYHNHIHQLRGTVEDYNKQYKSRRAHGVFFTTSRIARSAKVASMRIGIETHEKFVMPEPFPIVKCKLSEGKYYLPDDWGYDKVELNLGTGDCYCITVSEADSKGFKWAYLYGRNCP